MHLNIACCTCNTSTKMVSHIMVTGSVLQTFGFTSVLSSQLPQLGRFLNQSESSETIKPKRDAAEICEIGSTLQTIFSLIFNTSKLAMKSFDIDWDGTSHFPYDN